MKSILFSKKIFLIVLLLLFKLSNGQAQVVETYDYTGAERAIQIPFGVASLRINAWGGGGAGGGVHDKNWTSATKLGDGGGGSAFATYANYPVVDNLSFVLRVGKGGTATSMNGGNGENSYLRFQGTTADIVRAAGGFGGEGSDDSSLATNGRGGTAATSLGTTTTSGSNGTKRYMLTSGKGGNAAGTGGGLGGDAIDEVFESSDGNNGKIPGGGGSGAKVAWLLNGTRLGGNGGNGRMVVSYTLPNITLKSNVNVICEGNTATLSVSLSDNIKNIYTYIWTANGVVVGTGDTINVTPSETTTYTSTGTYISNTGLAYKMTKTITITVNPPAEDINITKVNYPLGADDCSVDYVALDFGTNVTLAPVTGLYLDAGLTQPYTNGLLVNKIYGAPNGVINITATSKTGSCSKTSSVELVRNKKEFTALSSFASWSTNGNWFPVGIPTADKCVVVKVGKSVGIARGTIAVARSVTVENNAMLNISGNSSLTLSDKFVNYNNTEDAVVLESGSSLKQTNPAVTNIGNVSVKRSLNFSSGRKEYNFLSTPVIFKDGHSFKTIYPGVTTGYLPSVLYYVEKTGYFLNSSGANVLGRAVAVQEPLASNISGLIENSAVFKGLPFNGDVDFPLAFSSAENGYNLVGNPYPSNIDLVVLYQANINNIEADFRFWDRKANNSTTQEGSGYSGRGYAVYNAISGIGNPAGYFIGAGIENTVMPTRNIRTGQGFMVKALGINKVLRFNNPEKLRTVENTGNFFGFNKNNDEPNSAFWLTVKNENSYVLTTAITYIDGLTETFGKEDSKLDLEEDDSFYTLTSDNVPVIINAQGGFNLDNNIKLGAKFHTSGEKTIALSNTEGIFKGDQPIFLIDNENGAITDLTKESYNFTTNVGEYTGRFVLTFKPESVLGNQDEINRGDILIYKDGGDLVVRSSTKTINEVHLFSATGQLMRRLNTNNKQVRLSITDLTKGIYIIKISYEGHILTKKIIK